MAFDFPTVPTIGQIANGFQWDGEKWLGSAGPAVPDAPSDNGEYVRVNGLWRLKSRSLDLTGLVLVDVPVPAAAKMAKLAISAKMGATGSLILRWSVDGTTFPAGASDYTVAGFFHQSGTGGYATQAIANLPHWILTASADNLTIFHTVDLTMGLRKGAGVFTGNWKGSSYNNAAAGGMTHYVWGGYSNFAWPSDQIKTIRVYASSGTAMAQGAIEAEWVY